MNDSVGTDTPMLNGSVGRCPTLNYAALTERRERHSGLKAQQSLAWGNALRIVNSNKIKFININKVKMKRFTLTIFGVCLTMFSLGQTNNNQVLIDLGKAYKNFVFRNEPDKNSVKDLKSNVPENLKVTTDFIVQTITTNNKLLTQTFLKRPTDQVLKQIYISNTFCPTYTFGNNLKEEVTDPNVLHCIFRNPLEADGIL